MTRQTTLRGYDAERATLAHLLDDVRKGESRALVLVGEPSRTRHPSIVISRTARAAEK
jgi:hypothetical protein